MLGHYQGEALETWPWFSSDTGLLSHYSSEHLQLLFDVFAHTPPEIPFLFCKRQIKTGGPSPRLLREDQLPLKLRGFKLGVAIALHSFFNSISQFKVLWLALK